MRMEAELWAHNGTRHLVGDLSDDIEFTPEFVSSLLRAAYAYGYVEAHRHLDGEQGGIQPLTARAYSETLLLTL